MDFDVIDRLHGSSIAYGDIINIEGMVYQVKGIEDENGEFITLNAVNLDTGDEEDYPVVDAFGLYDLLSY